MTKLSKKITSAIKKKKVSQTPKIIFILKNIGFWALFALAALVGAAAFSIILLALFETDFEATKHLLQSPAGFLLTTPPLTWITLFTILFSIALFGIRHTKKGYKFSVKHLVLGNIGISLILGGIFYGFGGAHAFERGFAHTIPMYKMLEERREKLWSNPEKGLLSGKIIKVTNETIVILEDDKSKQWKVMIPQEITHMPPHIAEVLGREVQIPEGAPKPPKKEERSIRVKLVGKQTGDDTFTAELLLPWNRNRMLPERVKEKYGNNFRPPKEAKQMMRNMKEAIEEGDADAMKKAHEEMREMHESFPPEKGERKGGSENSSPEDK